jgi:hypothetical protein
MPACLTRRGATDDVIISDDANVDHTRFAFSLN